MNMPKKIASLLTISLMMATSYFNASALTNETNSVNLVGEDRFDTAVKVCKNGWISSSQAVIVNDSSIVDALSATPFAKAKNAPILLTSKNELNSKTKYRLKSLGVKRVYLIGGTSVLSSNVENALKKEGMTVERISGQDRYETSLVLAKKLNTMESISEIAVVNGEKGLADAVSIGAAAAQYNMPIILAHPTKGTEVANNFINSKYIENTYIVGGESSISRSMEKNLPNTVRLGGSNRNETNAMVIEEFYEDTNLKDVYITKDGRVNQNQLIDALSVGVLAAKNESPVMLVSNTLTDSQRHICNTKSFANVAQVGGNGNEDAFNQLVKTQERNTYKVKTVKELRNALSESKANDIIEFRPSDDIDEDFSIKSDYAVNVILEEGTYNSDISVNMTNGSFTNKGNVDEICIDSIRKGTLLNSGKIETLEIYDKNECKVVNARGAQIDTLIIESKSKNVTLENRGNITTLEVNAEDVEVKNLGFIENLEGDEKPEITGNKPLSEDLKTFPVADVKVKDDTTVKVIFTKPVLAPTFKWDSSTLDESKVKHSLDRRTYTLTVSSIGNNSHSLTITKYGYEDYKKRYITYGKSEELRQYLESTTILQPSYTMSTDIELNSTTLGKNKTIDLNGNTLTFKGNSDFKTYKITFKGSGKIVFKDDFSLKGDGDKGVFMDQIFGSNIDAQAPNGYVWKLGKLIRSK